MLCNEITCIFVVFFMHKLIALCKIVSLTNIMNRVTVTYLLKIFTIYPCLCTHEMDFSSNLRDIKLLTSSTFPSNFKFKPTGSYYLQTCSDLTISFCNVPANILKFQTFLQSSRKHAICWKVFCNLPANIYKNPKFLAMFLQTSKVSANLMQTCSNKPRCLQEVCG